jgi:hypothetical protein
VIRSVLLGLLSAQTLAMPIATPDNIGAWTIERNKDPKTGAVVTSAHVKGDRARLDYGCNDGGGAPTMLIITSSNFLGGVEGAAFRPVTFRADEGHPITLNLRYDDNTAGALYNDILRPVKAALLGGRSLSVRLVTQLGDPVDASFDITGSNKALALVDDACKRTAVARE